MLRNCAEAGGRILAALAVLLVAACGGGNSTQTVITGPGAPVALAEVSTPTGPNTTEIVVDAGPGGFGAGAINVPYVTVTVCVPGSSECATIDHVMLDTGSYGLRLLKSGLQGISLPSVNLDANAQRGTPAGRLVECYPFILGGVWGPVMRADVRLAGEKASAIPIQVIDDRASAEFEPPADCLAAANGTLFSTVSGLQARGILGVGMVGLDCGVACSAGNYAGFHVQYHVCPGTVTAQCSPAAVPAALQVQNPVVHLVPDDGNAQADNNGTLIRLPAVPTLGATVAKGRLVFGIGTRANNQLPTDVRMLAVQTNPADPSYLYFTTTMGSREYPDSFIDSGSNGYFFNDTGSTACAGGTGSGAHWYCPGGNQPMNYSTVLGDRLGTRIPLSFSLTSADVLFQTSSAAVGQLGGSAGPAPNAFVFGLSFFYGRSVYTSIWGQPLATQGPWNAF